MSPLCGGILPTPPAHSALMFLSVWSLKLNDAVKLLFRTNA